MSVSFETLARCAVTDLRGDTVELGHLWRERAAVLVFVRHFGCVMCRRQIADMRDAIVGSVSTRIAIVGNGQRIHAKWFRDDLDIPEVDVFVDPKRAAYRAAGMHRSLLSVINPFTLGHAIRAHRAGHRQVGVQGDNFQRRALGASSRRSRVVVPQPDRRSRSGLASPASHRRGDPLMTTIRCAVTRAEIERDRATYDQCLDEVRRSCTNPVEGLVGPDSMVWHVVRERIMLFGALRAILLQIAHPAIAAAIAQQSSFRNNIAARSRRTMRAVYSATFGTLDDVLETGIRTHRIHTPIRGTIERDEPGPEDRTQTPYRANDPELLWWVEATLIDTAFVAFERYVRALTPEEKDSYYADSMRYAAIHGIPAELRPPDRHAFYEFYDAKLRELEGRMGETARGLCHLIFHKTFRFGPVHETLTTGLLPPRWRELFGLRWGLRQRAAFRTLVAAGRTLRRLAPARFRFVPAYHAARTRIERASAGHPA